MKATLIALCLVCVLAVGCADNPITLTPDGVSTPLHEAVKNSDIDAVRLLLITVGTDVNAGDDIAFTPLYYTHTADIVRLLITAGANVNARDNIAHYTPLHLASNAEVAITLIEAGADVNARSSYGLTPLGKTRNSRVADVIRAAGGVE